LPPEKTFDVDEYQNIIDLEKASDNQGIEKPAAKSTHIMSSSKNTVKMENEYCREEICSGAAKEKDVNKLNIHTCLSKFSSSPLSISFSNSASSSTSSNASSFTASSSNLKKLKNSKSMVDAFHSVDDFALPSSSAILRFYVRSLGWIKINEQDLTPEKSSKAVNKCINDLSRGTNDFNDVVARWGDVKAFLYFK
jgi:hypothetical protein